MVNDVGVQLERKIISNILQHSRINIDESKNFKTASRDVYKCSPTQQ